jgi:hypothetical protein
MTGFPRADLWVEWVGRKARGVADSGADHAGVDPEFALRTPKATHAKDCLLKALEGVFEGGVEHKMSVRAWHCLCSAGQGQVRGYDGRCGLIAKKHRAPPWTPLYAFGLAVWPASFLLAGSAVVQVLLALVLVQDEADVEIV